MGLALASMVNAGPAITKILVVLLFFSLIMAIITAIAGSSRTLNQGGRDGWLPKYLSYLKSTRRPHPRHVDRPRFQSHPVVDVEPSVRAGGLKLQLPDLQLPEPQRRLDSPHRQSEREAAVALPEGTILAYVNAFLHGAGANVWGNGTLISGFVSAAIIVPIFAFRHYVVDKGVSQTHV